MTCILDIFRHSDISVRDIIFFLFSTLPVFSYTTIGYSIDNIDKLRGLEVFSSGLTSTARNSQLTKIRLGKKTPAVFLPANIEMQMKLVSGEKVKSSKSTDTRLVDSALPIYLLVFF